MASTSEDAKQMRGWRNVDLMKFDGREGHGFAKIDEYRMII